MITHSHASTKIVFLIKSGFYIKYYKYYKFFITDTKMFSVGSFLGTHMLEAEQDTQFTCLTLVFYTSLAMVLINCMTRVFITALTKG